MLRRAASLFVAPVALAVAACGGAPRAAGSGAGSAESTGSSSGAGAAGGETAASTGTTGGTMATGTTGTGGAGGSTGTGMAEQGRATYYAADGSGNCGFDPSPNDLDVAAMDAPEWDDSGVCGECVAIQGPKGSVTVRIVDQCPECEKGHLDLSQEAFAKIADVSAGNVPITWSVVPCDVTGDIEYVYKDGSSQWWTALQVRNSRWAIESLEWELNGVFLPIPRQSYNYFVAASGVGPNAIQVRVTASTGQQIVDMLPAPASGLVVQGSAQFN